MALPISPVRAASPVRPTVSLIQADISRTAALLNSKGVVSYANNSIIAAYIANHGSDHPAKKCLATYNADTSGRPTCVLGKTSSKIAMVLFGDSHAWQWVDALSAVARSRNMALYVYARAACPPEIASSQIWQASGPTPYPACDTWRVNALQAIKTLRPKEILFSELTSGTSPTMDIGLSQLIPHLISATGGNRTRVVWLRSTPVLASSQQSTFATCLARTGLKLIKSPDGSTGCYTTVPIATGAKYSLNAVASRMLSIANAAGIIILDPMPWLCQQASPNGICPPVILGRGVYYDQYHIANSYAMWLQPLLSSHLPR